MRTHTGETLCPCGAWGKSSEFRQAGSLDAYRPIGITHRRKGPTKS